MSRKHPPQNRSAFLRERIAQYCDGGLPAEETAELEQWLREDPRAMESFLLYMELHAQIAWNARAHAEKGSGFRVQGSECGTRDSGFGVRERESPVPKPEPPVWDAEPLIPPIIIDTSHDGPYPWGGGLFAVGGPLFSYAAATVITGIIILIFWMWKVPLDGGAGDLPAQVAHTDKLPVPAAAAEPVGRITDMAGCRWANPQAAPVAAAPVPLAGKYELVSGLMEISYTSGAKVILQGPCTYEVDSPAGGFLSLGKLTAKVDSGQWSVASEKKSGVRDHESGHYPLATSHYPLFSVRTPTAVVTDLGTEFGVEVDKAGASQTYVFRGKVELRPTGGGEGGGEAVVMGENESARVENSPGGVVKAIRVTPGRAKRNHLARQMPKRVPIPLFNTGIGVKEGQPDPHWQITAITNDPRFKPRPALVTPVDSSQCMPNNPAMSQWISLVGDWSHLPHNLNVAYTFRTTFDLSGILPGTAAVRLRFAADNHVDAIRVNHRRVPVPEHGYDPVFRESFNEVRITKGFVDGTNVLEIDVVNGDPASPPSGESPMAVIVELEGSAVLDPTASSAIGDAGHGESPQKGGAPMNGP